MKQKPDEMPDQWIRQSLSQLPDAPPPGSTFDKDRLWARMQPELQAVPARQSIGPVWWAVATCLAGLALTWFWQTPLNDSHNAVAMHKGGLKASAAVIARPSIGSISRKTSADDIAVATTQSIVVGQGKSVHLAQQPKQKSTPALPESSEIDFPIPDLLPVTEVPLVVENRAEPGKPAVAIGAPKRRFRVMHENELRAEEETRPKLYRTDHFVRLGNGTTDENMPDGNHPSPIISLTTKSTQ